MTTRAFSPLDASAVGLSTACLLHCLALPVAAAVLPALGVVADNEWIHRGFVLVAMVVTGLALVRSMSGARWAFIPLAIVGLALLIAGAFLEPMEAHETPLTVAGALILASAHIWRWRRHV